MFRARAQIIREEAAPVSPISPEADSHPTFFPGDYSEKLWIISTHFHFCAIKESLPTLLFSCKNN